MSVVLPFFCRSLFLIFLINYSTFVFAGGPIAVSDTGVASAWDNSVSIPYHPESGTCGPYSNDDMIGMVVNMANHWSIFYIDEADIDFDLEEGALGQVGVDNYDDYLYLGEAGTEDNAADGINPIIFDDDGEI